MDWIALGIAFAAALAGSILATWTGFGSATILTPALVLFLDPRQAILVVAVYHGLHNLTKILTFRKHTVGRLAVLFGFGAVLASPVGGLLSSEAPLSVLMVTLGAFVAFDAVTGLLGKASQVPAIPGPTVGLVGGALSGLAAGVVGTRGAVRALFLRRFLAEKEAYVATSAVIAVMIDLSRVPVYLSLYPASATRNLLPITMTTVAAGFLGVFLGRSQLQRASTRRFQKVVLFALVAAGALLVFRGLSGP